MKECLWAEIKCFPLQSLMGIWPSRTHRWCPQVTRSAHRILFWVWSGSSTVVILETNSQPGGIPIESWYFSDNPSIHRAPVSTLRDKSCTPETVKRCNKYLPLVGWGSCQEQGLICLPPQRHKVIFSPPNTNLRLYHQCQNFLCRFQVKNQTNASVLVFKLYMYCQIRKEIATRWLGRTGSWSQRFQQTKYAYAMCDRN